MLEMRILYKFLPIDFDHLQNLLVSITYSPLNNNQKAIDLNNKCYKKIQETKRQWLHKMLSVYEIKLQQYDQQYQEVLMQLKYLLINNTSMNGLSLFNDINQDMLYRTNQLHKDISNKMCPFKENYFIIVNVQYQQTI